MTFEVKELCELCVGIVCQTLLYWNLCKSGRLAQTEPNLNNSAPLKCSQDTVFRWQFLLLFMIYAPREETIEELPALNSKYFGLCDM